MAGQFQMIGRNIKGPCIPFCKVVALFQFGAQVSVWFVKAQSVGQVRSIILLKR
jgi:hypothetical protein